MQDKMKALTVSSTTMAFSGARMPADFPALLARDLINEFASEGAVLDPCHGWGGRLVGFLLSDAKRYTGVDVSSLSAQGVQKLYETLKKHVKNKSVKLMCEDFIKSTHKSKFRFALTSPPYFDVEKYEGDEQPYKHCANYDAWRDSFYTQLIEKVYAHLENDGHFALQVGSQRYPLQTDGIKIAENAGFKLIEVRSSSMINNQMKTEEDKAENIIILKKP